MRALPLLRHGLVSGRVDRFSLGAAGDSDRHEECVVVGQWAELLSPRASRLAASGARLATRSAEPMKIVAGDVLNTQQVCA